MSSSLPFVKQLDVILLFENKMDQKFHIVNFHHEIQLLNSQFLKRKWKKEEHTKVIIKKEDTTKKRKIGQTLTT